MKQVTSSWSVFIQLPVRMFAWWYRPSFIICNIMVFYVHTLLTCLLTYLRTPSSRVPLEKLTGFQLVKKSFAFYGTRRFITAFTSARHSSLSWTNSIQSITPHYTSWRSILILSSHLHLGLPSGLFPSGLPTKILYTPLFSPIRVTCASHLILLDFITRNNIGWGVQIIKPLMTWFHPLPYYFIPLRPKYSFQHPVLKHIHPTFLPQWKRPGFTPIQNKRQNYNSVYLKL